MIGGRTICLTLASLFVAPAAIATRALAADAPAFDGKYTFSEDGYRERADIARTATGYSVSIVAGAEGCSGSFDGVGTVEGGKLIARVTDPDAKDDKCRIEISRTANGISIREDQCFNWHGASCDFERTLRKR